MSQERRFALIEALIDENPHLEKIVSNESSSLIAGNWDLVAYSYQQSFEALWDLACTQQSGLITMPLMMLWRQSVELTIKAAIQETIRGTPPGSHDLTSLFDKLVEARRSIAWLEPDDDDQMQMVRRTIIEFQNLDKQADRFRYPSKRDGSPYGGISVDLDRLHQAHWLITNWCDVASVEAEYYNIHVRQS